MEIIGVQEKEKWNRIIKGFSSWDIYYLQEYAKSLQTHGDGDPLLIYHESDGISIAYVMMQNDIADAEVLSGLIPEGMYYDWTTPYGYGGPLIQGEVSAPWIKNFMDQLENWCRGRNIVTQFFRFHPLLQNQKILEEVSDVVYLKKTIYMDTCDEDTIMKNMTPNNRNMVRKAQRNDITIKIDEGRNIEAFRRIYEATMQKNNAEDYYYFDKVYFDYITEHMKDNVVFFYAVYEEEIISSSIFFYNQNYMHYHLSGTLPQYNKLASTNLLLTSAARWACGRGIEKFHLGGGVGAEDSLLSFKKNFNRCGQIDFCIGRNIFDKKRFQELVDIRKKDDDTFDESKPFLIKYRG